MKTSPMISSHNSYDCRPIFKLLSLSNFQENSLCIRFWNFHFTLTTSLPHLVKYEMQNMKFMQRMTSNHHAFFECQSTAFQQKYIMLKVYVWNILRQLQCTLAVCYRCLPCSMCRSQSYWKVKYSEYLPQISQGSVARRPQLSIDIYCRSRRSAANPPAAAVDRWDAEALGRYIDPARQTMRAASTSLCWASFVGSRHDICCWAPAPAARRLLDISRPQGAQQEIHRPPVMQSIDGADRRTDGKPTVTQILLRLKVIVFRFAIYVTDYSTRYKAVFNWTESRFRFIVNPDLDSLANRMVWICERGRVWCHCY